MDDTLDISIRSVDGYPLRRLKARSICEVLCPTEYHPVVHLVSVDGEKTWHAYRWDYEAQRARQVDGAREEQQAETSPHGFSVCSGSYDEQRYVAMQGDAREAVAIVRGRGMTCDVYGTSKGSRRQWWRWSDLRGHAVPAEPPRVLGAPHHEMLREMLGVAHRANAALLAGKIQDLLRADYAEEPRWSP